MTQHNSNHQNKISNQSFLLGCQCTKALHLTVNNPNLAVTYNKADNQKCEQIVEIKKVAKRLFDAGVDARQSNNYLSTKRTLELISQNTDVIYNATLELDKIICTIDILVIEDKMVKGYMIKSSTKLKAEYELESAFQYHMFSAFGITLSDIQIVYINPSYQRKSSLDPSKLFQFQSLKVEALHMQIFVREKLDELRNVIDAEKIENGIGVHCQSPRECSFIEYCWHHIPPVSVFDLVRMTQNKKFAFYNDGIVEFEQLPVDAKLTDAQRRQVNCYQHKKDFIERDEITRFVTGIKYPIAFVDFETLQFPAPQFENTKPYQQIPFQFSLHYKETQNADLFHTEFLADAGEDPRIAFIESFLEATNIPMKTILTYNKSFEVSRLLELSKQFPVYADAINERILKIEDLMVPFSRGWYYNPLMNGSYSIKKVLPALIPDMSYNDLIINNGTAASTAFTYLYNCKDSNEINEIRKNLLKYCEMDTLAMVRILEKLENLIQTP